MGGVDGGESLTSPDRVAPSQIVSVSACVIFPCNIHRVSEKTGPFDILSYLCSDSYELHQNFQKYIGVACCEYGINICDSLTILC